MNSSIKFGIQLRELSIKKVDLIEIGRWCYSVYVNLPIDEDDKLLDDLLIHLGTMELGEEFAFTYEELIQIADDLIAGKPVNLG